MSVPPSTVPEEHWSADVRRDADTGIAKPVMASLSVAPGVRTLDYRPEIDGLRCIAVLSVIFYHAGFPPFSGGYLGVDIFFVISGYLITSIIAFELREGSFSLSRFYERRARRILPALFVVMTLCMAAAWLLLTPRQLAEFGESLIAVPLFVSNVLFAEQVGYFATDAELKPLLHTWSLAIEEQFYIVFPVALMVLTAFAKHSIRWVFLLLAIVSLGLAEWTASRETEAAFFLIHTRVWELLAGAIVAISGHDLMQRSANSKILSELFAGLGLIICVLAIFLFEENVRHPGFYTVVPILGTCLVIAFATSETMIGKLLSQRLFVATGLLSYSLYLYHQPVFAFMRIRETRDLSPAYYVVAVFVCFVLAYITWKFVERPFRNRQTIGTTWLVLACSIFTLAPITAGIAAKVSNGFSARLNERVALVLNDMRLASEERIRGIKRGKCYIGQVVKVDSFIDRWNCLSITDGPIVLMVGDSHAADTAWAMRTAGIKIGILGGGGCPLFPDPKNEACTKILNYAIGLAQRGKIQGLVLANHWTPGEVSEFKLRRMEEFWNRAGLPILMFTPMPQFGRLENLVQTYVWNDKGLDTIPYNSERLSFTERPLRLFADKPGFTLINTREMFCGSKDGTCSAFVDQRPLTTRDGHHLSGEGARLMGKRIAASPVWKKWIASLPRPQSSTQAPVSFKRYDF